MATTYVLERGGNAPIPLGPLRFEGHLEGLAEGLALSANAPSTGAELRQIAPRDGLLILPSPLDGTRVLVAPKGGGSFPSGAMVSLTISPDSVDPSVRLTVAKVDVSGLSSHEVVVISLADSGAIIRRPTGGRGEVFRLDGLAQRAETVTREVLGVDEVDQTAVLNVAIAVDGSASMLGAIRRGDVRALVEVLVGISSVIGPGRPLHAAVVRSDVEWMPGHSPAEMPETLAAALDSRPLSTDFAAGAPGLIGRVPDQNTMTWVLTDSTPGDLDRLQAADTIEGEARHLVFFGYKEVLKIEGDPGVVSTVIVPIDAEEGVHGRLQFDSMALRAVVTSLLQGCFVPGTVFAKRVAL